MATWKKIVVSGSNISQLNNDAGYLTTATSPVRNAFASASINGTILIAPSASGSLNFASSSGQGLTIAGNTGTNTLTFGLTAIPNASLANSSVTIGSTNIALGATSTTLAGLTSVTSTNFTGTASYATQALSASFASTAPYSGLSGVPVGIVSGSSQVTALLPTGTVSGSSQIVYSGITGVPSGIVSGSSQITYSGISGIPSGIISGSSLSAPATQGQVQLTTNGVAQSAVNLFNLSTTSEPTFAGATLGNITVGVTTDNTINTTTGNLTVSSAGGTTTLSDANVIITNNLQVNGTATYVNTADLYVADKFILLASGSATDGDGGIIIDRGSFAQGNIGFGYDSATNRWGFQDGVVDTTNVIDPTAGNGVSGSFVGLVFTEAAHGATKPITGEFAKAGAIYTATNEDIWIYS